MHLFTRGLLSCFLALAAFLSGCTTAGVGDPSPAIPVPVTSAQLRPGDSLTVTLQGVPDPTNNAVTIDDKGLITLPFIGAMPAAGLSTAELSQSVRTTYVQRKIYTNVDVSVSVTERFVYVGGEVQHPGRVVWTPDLTAATAIQSAGGFSLYAKESAVTLVRDRAAYVIDIKAAQKNPANDPKLVPGDSLQVPRSPF
ncbi:polysaccharide biosynthesis/export family protein [Opitutus sp. ER46]|uniref:polysaccharide biosynthesis/export family protein n=1 Tax=Opitutus sp. ER46 TaxID=2161864 RepID=UPI000D31286A|nr:polysaccharide biosynthesis/export family protein [Opitutus sp. ER46]PTX99026.1 hypothetical protein DB354_03130 [Opitutus sp. ER46]